MNAFGLYDVPAGSTSYLVYENLHMITFSCSYFAALSKACQSFCVTVYVTKKCV